MKANSYHVIIIIPDLMVLLLAGQLHLEPAPLLQEPLLLDHLPSGGSRSAIVVICS